MQLLMVQVPHRGRGIHKLIYIASLSRHLAAGVFHPQPPVVRQRPDGSFWEAEKKKGAGDDLEEIE